MKKIIVVLGLMLIIISCSVAYANMISAEVILNKNIIITYNGEIQKFRNASGEVIFPISYDGTTYLPIRSISCLFQTEIDWSGETNSIYLGKGSIDKFTSESIGEFKAGTNEDVIAGLNSDIKIYYKDKIQIFKDVNDNVVYPLTYQGTTYLPVRAISNLYNTDIEWNGDTYTIAIKERKLTPPDAITEVFEVKGYVSTNGVLSYIVRVKEDNNKEIFVRSAEFGLPKFLYNFSDDNMLLKITYSKPSYKVYACTVINAKTNEEITDLSEHNIRTMFDIEYGKTIEDNPWTNKIAFSDIKPDIVYRYTAVKTTQVPEIINNIGKNCIVYTKKIYHDDNGRFYRKYDKEINMFDKIEATKISFTYNEYEAGDALYIMYKVATPEDLLLEIKESEIVRLSKYKSGQELSYDSDNEYIYNDTANEITLTFRDVAFGMTTSKTIKIGVGMIYGLDWMVDSVSIK